MVPDILIPKQGDGLVTMDGIWEEQIWESDIQGEVSMVIG